MILIFKNLTKSNLFIVFLAGTSGELYLYDDEFLRIIQNWGPTEMRKNIILKNNCIHSVCRKKNKSQIVASIFKAISFLHKRFQCIMSHLGRCF